MSDNTVPVPNANDVIRTTDFTERYANNVRFESSFWDLKLLFGTLDQTTTPLTICQHTHVNIPWAQVKLAAYYMYVNIMVHELRNGPVRLPETVMPTSVAPFLEGLGDLPGTKALLEKCERLREELKG